MSSNSNTDQYCKSVKALIYNSAGEILIQQRDYKHGLRWPGAWNLFGGMIENDETFLEGVERELIEELGILPGKIEDVIFEWVSEDGVLDKCFSVFQSNKNLNITLKEGNSMKWVHPTDLINLEKTPFLENNISNIISFFSKDKKKLALSLEKKIISSFDLIKKNERVFYIKNNLSLLKKYQVMALKELAILKLIPLMRVCLHNSDELPIHEMIMIHSRPQKVGPLKQERNNSLSYHIIYGSGEILLYSEKGDVEKTIIIDSNHNGFKFCRLNANQFRSIESKSDYMIFLEVCSGPFKDEDTIWMKDI